MTLSDNELSTVDKLIDKIETEDNSRYEDYGDEVWEDSWTNVLLTSKGVYYFNLLDINNNKSSRFMEKENLLLFVVHLVTHVSNLICTKGTS